MAAHLDATTKTEIDTFLKQHGVAVVDLYATWCGPCKAIAPYVEEKSKSTGISVIKIDVDKSEALSALYAVTAMPTFLVVKGTAENVVEKVVGGGQANVDKMFNKAIASK